MMKWTKQKPTVEGYYLRWNPAGDVIERQRIIKIDGELWADGLGPIPLEEVSGAFCWFGPIPMPWKTVEGEERGK